MVIISPHGLCNRLNHLFTYLGEMRSKGEKITFIWQVNDACNGYFTDCFEPIEGVEMVETSSVEGFHPPWKWPLDISMYQLLKDELKPKSELVDKIEQWKTMMVYDYIAVHLRRTDYVEWMLKFNTDIKNDEAIFRWIDSQPSDSRIFLATDSDLYQNIFQDRYGSRVYFNKITPSENFRKTSLQEAVIDMYVCAGAKKFKGTTHTTFSGAIYALRGEFNEIGQLYNV